MEQCAKKQSVNTVGKDTEILACSRDDATGDLSSVSDRITDQDNNNRIYREASGENCEEDSTRVSPISHEWTDCGEECYTWQYSFEDFGLSHRTILQNQLEECAVDGFEFDSEFIKQWNVVCAIRDRSLFL